MATKAEGEAWLELGQLSLDENRSNHRSARASDHDTSRQFQGDAADQGKSPENPRNEATEEGSIDIAIRQALMDPKERTTVLRIEDQVEKFMQDSTREELEFPNNFSNYQRMLAHRVSQYYGLQTSVKDGFQEGPGRVVAKKTEHLRVPQTKLGDLKTALYSRPADRVSGTKVLQRRPVTNDSVKPANASNANNPPPALSMKAREEDYNEARERMGLGKTCDSSSSSSGGKPKQSASKFGNGAARATPNNGARSTQRKAVIRDKEKDLQDPDYKRGVNRFNPQLDAYPLGQGPPMYSMPVFPGEVGMPKAPASPTSSTNSAAFRPEFHQPWNACHAGFRPPPPPPPPQPCTSPKAFLANNGPPPMSAMPRPMMAYASYPAMPGMHFHPAMPPPGVSPQAMYPHPNIQMAYPMMPGYAFMPPGQEGMQMPAMHMYPGYPAAFHSFPHSGHPGMPRAPMPMGMPMMMGMPGHFHVDLAHGMHGFGMERGPSVQSRQRSSGSSFVTHAPHVSIQQIDDGDSKSKNNTSSNGA